MGLLPGAQRTSGPIGVFDSGVGGLTVLKALIAQLPAAHTRKPSSGADAVRG